MAPDKDQSSLEEDQSPSPVETGGETPADDSIPQDDSPQQHPAAPAQLLEQQVRRKPLDERLKGLTPVNVLYAEHVHKYIAYAVAFVSLLVCIGVISWNAHVYKQQERFIALDGSNTFHIGIVGQDQTPVFQSTALLAAQAHYLRSPTGLDLPELVSGLYSQAAQASLAAEVEAQKDDFDVRSIRQKPEISEIRALREREGLRFVEVRGDLVRAGSFRGVPIVETEPFAILYALQRNPNLGARGQFPYVVVNYRLAEFR